MAEEGEKTIGAGGDSAQDGPDGDNVVVKIGLVGDAQVCFGDV
jgi:hypothetical protein